MIDVFEGLGGWTIKVTNNGNVTPFECGHYIITDEHGTNWFDFDRAMRDAKALDAQQNKDVTP